MLGEIKISLAPEIKGRLADDHQFASSLGFFRAMTLPAILVAGASSFGKHAWRDAADMDALRPFLVANLEQRQLREVLLDARRAEAAIIQAEDNDLLGLEMSFIGDKESVLARLTVPIRVNGSVERPTWMLPQAVAV